MIYKHGNHVLPSAINDLYMNIVKYIIYSTRQKHYLSIRVILISTQNVLETQVLAYGMLLQNGGERINI